MQNGNSLDIECHFVLIFVARFCEFVYFHFGKTRTKISFLCEKRWASISTIFRCTWCYSECGIVCACLTTACFRLLLTHLQMTFPARDGSPHDTVPYHSNPKVVPDRVKWYSRYSLIFAFVSVKCQWTYKQQHFTRLLLWNQSSNITAPWSMSAQMIAMSKHVEFAFDVGCVSVVTILPHSSQIALH